MLVGLYLVGVTGLEPAASTTESTLHLFIYIYFHYHTPTVPRGGHKLRLQKIVKFCAVIFYSIIVRCKAVLVFYGYICSIFNK